MVTAPVDVLLPEKDEADEDVISVVQPDIVVKCDKTKINRRGCRGAPDLIVEILSKATAAKDQIQKVAFPVFPKACCMAARLLEERTSKISPNSGPYSAFSGVRKSFFAFL